MDSSAMEFILSCRFTSKKLSAGLGYKLMELDPLFRSFVEVKSSGYYCVRGTTLFAMRLLLHNKRQTAPPPSSKNSNLIGYNLSSSSSIVPVHSVGGCGTQASITN